MEKFDLLKHDEKKVFFHYLIPSICSTLVTAIYILADTLIIGQGVGAQGISALNIFLPFYSVYMGIGLLFGVGGGILISMEDGIGNKEKSNQYFITSVISISIVAIIFTILTNLFLKEICLFLGADSNSIDLVLEYGKYIAICTPIFICTNFLGPIVRNRKEPKLAMIAVLSGAGLNILLDYIFVFPMNMGMEGAAIATIIGSSVTSLVLITHFIKKQNRVKIKIKQVSLIMVKKIIGCGGASFLMEVASGFVIFIFNIQILRYIGNEGIVIYGIISNCIIVGTALFNGVAQASQPVIATNYGAKEEKRVNSVLNYAFKTTALIGLILFSIVVIFTKEIILLFVDAHEEIINLGIPAIRLYLSAFCLMNINILICNYYQSISKEKLSISISIIRGFLLNIVLVILLPKLLGSSALWMVVPITELITFLGIYMYYLFKKANVFDKTLLKVRY